MKLKILSLILIMFLLPGALVLSACSKGGGYNLSNLNDDFYSITEDKTDYIVKRNNKIIYTYSEDVANAVENYEVYATLNDYNYIYENIMNFSFNYIEVCSNNEISIDKDVKNSLEKKLNELHTAIRNVDITLNSFNVILKTTDVDADTNQTCLDRYQSLLISYENLFEKASLFNFELSNIYFNYLITNSNPNINEINAANFDVNIVVSKLNARKSWQISNLSSAFAEMFICGSSVAKEIVEGNEFNLNPEEFSYTDMITAIDRDINEGAAIQVAQNNQLAFYQSSQKAYAAQTVLNNDSLKYINACKSVKYAKTITDEHEQNNINCKIIKNYSDVLVQYNAVLVEMLDIIEV